MNFEFKLPDIGEGLVEGEIVKWFVKAGDAVRENDPLAAVLTDKAEGKTREYHWGDMWHYALALLVVAARANGLRPVDGPVGDFSDFERSKICVSVTPM